MGFNHESVGFNGMCSSSLMGIYIMGMERGKTHQSDMFLGVSENGDTSEIYYSMEKIY